MLELQFLFAPFVACLVIAGIHAYLGIHVIEREVIFVDLSLAQIAALGAAFGLLIGYDFGSTQSYILSLVFTIFGAGIFSLSRTRDKRVPQEAIIGIVYAVSAAAFVLSMVRAPEGAEKIKGMLVGSCVYGDVGECARTAILYAIFGAFHSIFRKKIIMISQNPAGAIESGIPVRLWDFLFYMSFGLMVTASVAIAGVLLVFSYLIVPSVIALLFTKKLGIRLGIGWTISVLASVLGMVASLMLDMPTGAAIVCTFGLLLLAAGLLGRVQF